MSLEFAAALAAELTEYLARFAREKELCAARGVEDTPPSNTSVNLDEIKINDEVMVRMVVRKIDLNDEYKIGIACIGDGPSPTIDGLRWPDDTEIISHIPRRDP